MSKHRKDTRGEGRESESIDDRLESQRQEPSIDLVPVGADDGSPDNIPRVEQSQETLEFDSPEQAFNALSLPKNEDEIISEAGVTLEELNEDLQDLAI